MRVTSADLLEYEALKELLGRFVSSYLGQAEVERTTPASDRAVLEEVFAETAEAIAHERVLEQPQPAARGSAVRVRFHSIPDCREALAKMRIEGSVLDGTEILAITNLLDLALDVRASLDFSAEAYPRLAQRALEIQDFRPLLRQISGKLLPDGTVADDASVALRRLRREVERQHRKIQESLERFLRSHREEGILQEDFVTIRNDRFVVPVVAGKQGRVDGVVHGSSGTGHTLFVEPLETIALNNELVRVSEEEMREVHRILREMTGQLRAEAAAIDVAVQALGHLEFLFAKARFALRFGCVVPRFSDGGGRRLMLRDARHPLLQDVLARQKKEVVPVSLSLDERRRTLLISGPNTGGKTVCLKTVGLLALMAQSGFPIPCAEAELPVFREVLADIGDNQSIQESLSTFSAHIARIRRMLDEVGPDSLVLMDELGRATDPEEGGALGVAVLEEFQAAGAFSLASTHLMAIKVYGANTEGVVNGSMGFDEHTLQPTYHLHLGTPGKSAGLDIASRLGLPPAIIERARSGLTTSERDIARFLSELHARLERTAALEREVEERTQALAEQQRSLAGEWEKREARKLNELERRADALMADFEERARQAIEEIEREAVERKAAAQARRKVARARREFQEQFEAAVHGNTEAAPAKPALAAGARVRLRGVREPARVLRFLGEDRIEVQAGFLKLQVTPEQVAEVLPEGKDQSRLPRNVTLQAGPKAYVTTQEINVIGHRAEEAVSEVDKFLDSAALGSVDRVRIIHGHGMGVLRRAIAELLSSNPHVAKYYPASPAEGGTGATIAELKD